MHDNAPIERVLYKDVILDIEIPLVIKNKETAYQSSYPDMGWCREPLILVAKNVKDTTMPKAACVHPDTAPQIVKRGWAQHTPTIPQQLQDLFEDKLAHHNLVYKYGNAKPIDSFRAALLGQPHIDDIQTIGKITSNPSNNHTLQEIIPPDLLKDIKPPYSTTTYRDLDLGITLQEYQDLHKVCKEGYDYYVRDGAPPNTLKSISTKWDAKVLEEKRHIFSELRKDNSEVVFRIFDELGLPLPEDDNDPLAYESLIRQALNDGYMSSSPYLYNKYGYNATTLIESAMNKKYIIIQFNCENSFDHPYLIGIGHHAPEFEVNVRNLNAVDTGEEDVKVMDIIIHESNNNNNYNNPNTPLTIKYETRQGPTTINTTISSLSSAIQLTITGIDLDDNPITYTLQDAPPFIHLTNTTLDPEFLDYPIYMADITFDITDNTPLQPGIYYIKIIADDTTEKTDYDHFIIVVETDNTNTKTEQTGTIGDQDS
jgi:hypothetical protein